MKLHFRVCQIYVQVQIHEYVRIIQRHKVYCLYCIFLLQLENLICVVNEICEEKKKHHEENLNYVENH